ncbi:hypothetical protein ACJX0J_007517, partial [Zea mays]
RWLKCQDSFDQLKKRLISTEGDYYLEIHYHPGKANLIVEDFRRLNLGIVAHTEGVTIDVELTLEQEIRKGQIGDAKIQEIKDLITERRGPEFMEDELIAFWYGLKRDVATHVAIGSGKRLLYMARIVCLHGVPKKIIFHDNMNTNTGGYDSFILGSDWIKINKSLQEIRGIGFVIPNLKFIYFIY